MSGRWLFTLKLIKIKSSVSPLVILDPFQMLSSHMLVVATILDSTDTGHFHHGGKFNGQHWAGDRMGQITKGLGLGTFVRDWGNLQMSLDERSGLGEEERHLGLSPRPLP